MDAGLKLVGLTQLLEKERTVGAKTEGLLTEKLREVGDEVARDTSGRYQGYSPMGASGVQAKVFTSGVWVV